jgi:hypothetical protein
MYVEERMYLLHPGKAPEYFKHYEEVGMKVQMRHLPNLVGYYVTEAGMQNLVTHMWAYDDLNQREKMRAAMQADPDWQALDERGQRIEPPDQVCWDTAQTIKC